MNDQDFKNLTEKTARDLEAEYTAFLERVREGTSDPDHPMTLMDIESDLVDTKKRMGAACNERLSELLCDIDEEKIVEAKKGNISERE